MKKRLFLYSTLIILAGLLCFFAASIYITNMNNRNLAKDTVMETARILAGLYHADMDISAIVKAGADTRVTIIAPDGKVIADSRPLDVAALENHLSRPEILAAAKGSPEAFVRYSESLGVNLIYYALKVNSGGSHVFIRASVPVAKIDAYLAQSAPLLILSLLLVAAFCFFFVRSMANRIISPFYSIEQKLRLLSKGEYKPEPATGNYEEIDNLVAEIDKIALAFQKNFDALRDEKMKLDYVLRNIGDGLFVIDRDRDITLINSAALDIFNAEPDIVGKNLNYLSYDKEIIEGVRDCIGEGEDAMFELKKNGRTYLTTIKRLPGTSLIMLVLSDVTENRENAKRREEFFANASHELKTPLTAIKGFNELTSINNKDESLMKYIESITRETDRMLVLIGDMLKLSELENMQGINPVPVSLAKAVRDVGEALSAAMDEKEIIFEHSGDATVSGEPEHVYELLKNLVENAVRYNNEGGKVSVKIDGDKKNVWLLVSDNGIGIPPDEQTRIFERFYRVEKSRSQRNGGTGLGLSIVKHICALYGWQLSLKSKLGVGTEITVVFGPASL